MKIVIEIPDDYVKVIMKNQRMEGSAMDKLLRQAVIDGKQLPDGVTNEEQILNGFADMMKGFWGNQDLKVPNGDAFMNKNKPCEDCVSRKEVKEILNTRGQKAIMTFDHFIKLLDNLPPVTPARKKGKWTRVDHNKVKCSECEITHLIAQYPHGAINFCPNCGAEMESEE